MSVSKESVKVGKTFYYEDMFYGGELTGLVTVRSIETRKDGNIGCFLSRGSVEEVGHHHIDNDNWCLYVPFANQYLTEVQ